MSLERIAEMEALYAELPTIECKRLCAECCGPVPLTSLEYDRLAGDGSALKCRGLDCPMLSDGLCTKHDARPLICRLFGLVHAMACPFGCIPSRWLTDDEAGALMARAESIGGPYTLIIPTEARS